MEVESLAGLKRAFEKWRSRKRHPRDGQELGFLGAQEPLQDILLGGPPAELARIYR
jgi:hypothetical protein